MATQKISFGEQFSDWRLRPPTGEGKISQSEVAKRTGLSQGYISKLENGYTDPASIEIDDVLKILKVFGITLKDFVEAMSEESRARFESKRLVIESLTSPKENPTRGNAIPASDVSLHHVYPLKVADQPKEGLELPYPIILTPAQHRPRMLVLQMAGDEMRSLADNSIRNDDIFLVDLDEQTPTPDSIFVLKSGKNVYVRRCVKTATGDFWMVADNNSPEHLPIPIKDARVIGRAYLLLPNKPL